MVLHAMLVAVGAYADVESLLPSFNRFKFDESLDDDAINNTSSFQELCIVCMMARKVFCHGTNMLEDIFCVKNSYIPYGLFKVVVHVSGLRGSLLRDPLSNGPDPGCFSIMIIVMLYFSRCFVV